MILFVMNSKVNTVHGLHDYHMVWSFQIQIVHADFAKCVKI